MKKLKTWGGKRKGAGRPVKEPTKTLSYRVPEKLAVKIDIIIRKVIKTIKKESPNGIYTVGEIGDSNIPYKMNKKRGLTWNP